MRRRNTCITFHMSPIGSSSLISRTRSRTSRFFTVQ